MGIHISVHKILGIEEQSDSYPECMYKYFKKEEHPTWDWIRHSGDNEFWLNDSFDWVMRYEGDDGDDWEGAYHRPKDLDAAIKWVNENIVEINRPRLVEILTEMKYDQQLYFRCSY